MTPEYAIFGPFWIISIKTQLNYQNGFFDYLGYDSLTYEFNIVNFK